MNEPMSIVMCLPAGLEPSDPGPRETARRDIRLSSEWDADTRGVVGWSSGGWDALELAAAHQDLPRLVIVSLPFPDELPAELDLDAVEAKTLLSYGAADPQTGSSHGSRWQKRLRNARLEMVPNGSHDLLVPKWARVLSHLAPRRKAT
ncbi:MAG: hypothetical protein GY926_02535 [bacterium]|nr:hypothetical protein [bacterium]MCP4964092.1 hypothetical protein [bacterium]